MAQSKTTKTAPRARLAHKLAKYVRANPIHIQTRLSTQNPSTTHLSILFYLSQLSVDPKELDLEIMLTHGIQLMINLNCIKENLILPNLPLEENLFKLAMLSFSCQDHTKEEELSFLNHSLQEISQLLDHMPLTEFHSRELTQPMSFQHQPEFHSMVLMSTLMIHFSEDKETGLKAN